jgi:hypothetical protein
VFRGFDGPDITEAERSMHNEYIERHDGGYYVAETRISLDLLCTQSIAAIRQSEFSRLSQRSGATRFGTCRP